MRICRNTTIAASIASKLRRRNILLASLPILYGISINPHFADPILTNTTFAHFVSTIISRVRSSYKGVSNWCDRYQVTAVHGWSLHLAWHLVLCRLKSIQIGLMLYTAQEFMYQRQAFRVVGSHWPPQSWTKGLALSSHPHVILIGRIREVTSLPLPYFAHIPSLVVSRVIHERLTGNVCSIKEVYVNLNLRS